MTHDTAFLSTADGRHLFLRTWTPDFGLRGTVLLVHGIGEHSGRHAFLATGLMQQGFQVFAYDHRGHGQSDGERAYVERFGDYVADLAYVLDHLRAVRLGAEAGLPLFLHGHSLGGLIAASYVIDHRPADLAGLVLSSAALQVPRDLSPFLQKISGVVSRYAPHLATVKLDVRWLSHDPKVGRAFEEDPLCDHRGVRARTGAEILAATQRVLPHAEAFTLPLYCFHGTADRLTDPAGSRALHDRAPSPDKTLRLWEGLYHETLNEPKREAVLDDLVKWLTARAGLAR